MKKLFRSVIVPVIALLVVLLDSSSAFAQPSASTNASPRGFAPAGNRRGGRGGQRGASAEISEDRKITFRLTATNAISVRLVAPDLPNTGNSLAMTNSNGVWTATIGPVEPGAYRYSFNVDGLSVISPRNQASTETFSVSESGNSTSSILYVPGASFLEMRDVPHGAVATVTYYSKSLDRFRRMHVYTPPGYEKGSGQYPVLYLLHGFQDGDDAWSTVGRAGVILDNLIADKQAVPMILVMPSGQTGGGFGFGGGGRRGGGRDDFIDDLVTNVIPFIEENYRVQADAAHRAIAGMTSGGGQVLNVILGAPDKFGYAGLFSTAATAGGGSVDAWEESHAASLDDPKLKNNLKLLWASAGRDDPNIHEYRDTVAMLEKHGLKPAFTMSKGEGTWINWRSYLNEFAPQLFK